jgi:hypothetical protein
VAFAEVTVTVVDLGVKVVLAVVGFWLGYSSKRPKLEVQGSGSGGFPITNKDVMATTTTAYNRPSFFGLPVNREAATIVEARIYDPDLKEYVGPCLMWRGHEGPELTRECSIGSGRQATIYLFAKERYAEEFFVFAPSRPNQELPKQLTTYKDKKKDFSLLLVDVNRRKYAFDFTVRNSEQSVSVGFRVNKLRARWNLLRRALGPM